MAVRRIAVPPVPVSAPVDLRQWMQAVNLAIRDIPNVAGNGNTYINGGGGSGSGSGPGIEWPILVTPTGLTAEGALTSIILTWGGYEASTVFFTEVWRNTINDRDSATLRGITPGTMYADSGLEPGSQYYYWVRTARNGEYSPFNAVSGTLGQTSEDPAALLEILNNEISELQLVSTLNARISLIDAPGTGLVTQVSNQQLALDGQATQITTLTATVNGHTSSISNINSVNASQASQITTLQSSTASNLASIQTLQTTTNGLSAEYSVRIDVDGRVTGFGLYGSATSSAFIVKADKFAVGAPGATNNFPFIVSGNTVYMKAAMIQDGTITTAKIGDLAVDSAKIAYGAIVNSKIGNLSVDAAKIAFGTITNAQIATGTITNAQIATGTITNAQIATGTILNANIANGTIQTANIGIAQIDTLRIADNAVTANVYAERVGRARVENLQSYLDVGYDHGIGSAVRAIVFYQAQRDETSASSSRAIGIYLNGVLLKSAGLTSSGSQYVEGYLSVTVAPGFNVFTIRRATSNNTGSAAYFDFANLFITAAKR